MWYTLLIASVMVLTMLVIVAISPIDVSVVLWWYSLENTTRRHDMLQHQCLTCDNDLNTADDDEVSQLRTTVSPTSITGRNYHYHYNDLHCNAYKLSHNMQSDKHKAVNTAGINNCFKCLFRCMRLVQHHECHLAINIPLIQHPNSPLRCDLLGPPVDYVKRSYF